MTAARVAERGLRKVELWLVTPERSARALRLRSLRRRVRAPGGTRRGAAHRALSRRRARGRVWRWCRPARPARGPVVTLPRLAGPVLAGLPHDPEGFIPADLHGLVEGEHDVYAAGDATASPIKQGGIATQQADAAAEAIAARAGARHRSRAVPSRPARAASHRGLRPRYLRRTAAGPAATRSAPRSRHSGGRRARSPAAGSPPTWRCTTRSSRPGEGAGESTDLARDHGGARPDSVPPGARQRPAGEPSAHRTVVPRCRRRSRSRERPSEERRARACRAARSPPPCGGRVEARCRRRGR